MRRSSWVFAERQPFRQKPAITRSEMLVEHLGAKDPVGTELPEPVPQLAPGGHRRDVDIRPRSPRLGPSLTLLATRTERRKRRKCPQQMYYEHLTRPNRDRARI